MAKLNIKKGDTVVVIAGKDKGKTGKVLQVIAAANRAVVDGINIVTIHRKPKSQKDAGGIVKQPAPVQISNLMIICPICGKATRVSRKVVDGKNARVCKKCGESLDKAFVKAVKKDKKKEEVKVEEPKADAKKVEAVSAKATTQKKTLKTTAQAPKAVKVAKEKAPTTTIRKSSNRGK